MKLESVSTTYINGEKHIFSFIDHNMNRYKFKVTDDELYRALDDWWHKMLKSSKE